MTSVARKYNYTESDIIAWNPKVRNNMQLKNVEFLYIKQMKG